MKLRIAFVSPEFVTESTRTGGLAQFWYRLSVSLVQRGHDVHLLTYSDEGPGDFELDGIHVYRLVSSPLRRRIESLSLGRLRQSAKWLDYAWQAGRKLRQLHRRRPFHLVQFSNLYACGLLASLIGGLPHVVRAGNHRPVMIRRAGVPTTWDDRILTAVEWLQLRMSRHIYAPSDAVRRMLADHAGIDNIRVIRSPFYLETETWDSSVYEQRLLGKPYLLFFGRLQIHKGFHILAQALPVALESLPEAHVAIVGRDMPCRIAQSMRQYTLSLCNAVADQLIFLDELPHEQLYPIIAGARMVVFPSLIDNFPNACLESLGLATPVIGTIGASFDEILTDGETGFLVPRDDPGALAEKIVEAWNSSRLEEIGRAGAERVKSFAPERTVSELLAYYGEILSHHENVS